MTGFAEYDVPEPLRPGVCALHHHVSLPWNEPYRRLPMPWVVLEVRLGKPGFWRPPDAENWRRLPRVSLQGLTTRSNEACDPAGIGSDYVMALLEPWAVNGLMGVEPSALTDRTLDFGTFDNVRSAALLQRLVAVSAPEERLSRLADWLLEASRAPIRLDEEISWFLAENRKEAGHVSIARASAMTGMKARRFRQLFHKRVGVGPKQWAITERFSAALRQMHPRPWGEHDWGVPEYYDQAHEAHEFRRLAGVTPRQYRREKAAGDRRVYAVGGRGDHRPVA